MGDRGAATVGLTLAGSATAQGEERARTTLARQVDAAGKQWEKTLWHPGHQRFACEPDARTALTTQLKTCPDWLVVHAEIHALPMRQRPGRPRNDAAPDRLEWQVQATLSVDAEAVTHQFWCIGSRSTDCARSRHHRADHPQPAQLADRSPDDALGVPVF